VFRSIARRLKNAEAYTQQTEKEPAPIYLLPDRNLPLVPWNSHMPNRHWHGIFMFSSNEERDAFEAKYGSIYDETPEVEDDED